MKTEQISVGVQRIMKGALLQNLKVKKRKVRDSTYRSDKNKTYQLIGWIGSWNIEETSQDEWDDFICQLADKYKPRTFNQFLTLLRATLRTAVANNLITSNPIDAHNSLKPESCTPDPFTRNEISTLLSSNAYEIERALIKLGVSTGLRISELLAISQEAFDRNNRTLKIDQARVNGVFVAPKTKASNRTIELTPSAYEAMEVLIRASALLSQDTYEVVELNGKFTHRKRRLLARSSETGKLYISADDFRNSFFMNYCDYVKVRYRGPKNIRHTFACQMLTSNAPMQWIKAQMGHTGYEMLKDHYGGWISVDKSKSYDQAVLELNHMCTPLASVIESNKSVAATFSTEIIAANDTSKQQSSKWRWLPCHWFKRFKKVS